MNLVKRIRVLARAKYRLLNRGISHVEMFRNTLIKIADERKGHIASELIAERRWGKSIVYTNGNKKKNKRTRCAKQRAVNDFAIPCNCFASRKF